MQEQNDTARPDYNRREPIQPKPPIPPAPQPAIRILESAATVDEIDADLGPTRYMPFADTDGVSGFLHA